MYSFRFSGTSGNAYYDDFEALLSSVRFSNQGNEISNAKNTDVDLMSRFSFSNIVFSLLITIAVYSLPIVIYRYVVRKAPVDVKKAKKITIIYGICAFILMSAVIFTINWSGAAGGAILLWSQINYRILSGGKRSNINAGKMSF